MNISVSGSYWKLAGSVWPNNWNSNVICSWQTNLLTNVLNKDISLFDILDYHARSQKRGLSSFAMQLLRLGFEAPTDIWDAPDDRLLVCWCTVICFDSHLLPCRSKSQIIPTVKKSNSQKSPTVKSGRKRSSNFLFHSHFWASWYRVLVGSSRPEKLLVERQWLRKPFEGKKPRRPVSQFAVTRDGCVARLI